MARILDTTPAFEAYARKAAMEGPIIREILHEELYQAAHPEVFAAFKVKHESPEGLHAVVVELNRIRLLVREAAPVMAGLIEEVEPKVKALLGLGDVPDPRHVLMVGTLSTNASVGRIGDEVTVFHCLEWYQESDPARVLIAHEGTHAFHEILLGDVPDDLLWTAFAEGLAIRVSREAVPDRPDRDYFWYGVPGFEDWLPWCRENADALLERFRESPEDPSAVDTFFGSGLVEGTWRVGYFVADRLVSAIGRPPGELVRLSFGEAREAVRAALDA